MTRAKPAAASGPSHLHLNQPFLLQLSRRKWALLLLGLVSPAVVRRRRLKLADRATFTRISGIVFSENRVLASWMRGVSPSCLASPAFAARVIDACLCIFGRVNLFVAVVHEARLYSSDGKQRLIDILRKAICALEDETAGAVARLWLLLKLK
jgi:hypothetical protein